MHCRRPITPVAPPPGKNFTEWTAAERMFMHPELSQANAVKFAKQDASFRRWIETLPKRPAYAVPVSSDPLPTVDERMQRYPWMSRAKAEKSLRDDAKWRVRMNWQRAGELSREALARVAQRVPAGDADADLLDKAVCCADLRSTFPDAFDDHVRPAPPQVEPIPVAIVPRRSLRRSLARILLIDDGAGTLLVGSFVGGSMLLFWLGSILPEGTPGVVGVIGILAAYGSTGWLISRAMNRLAQWYARG